MDEAIEKSAMRKIYLRLLPFAILSYFLAYIDRINVSFAGADDARRSRHVGHRLTASPSAPSTGAISSSRCRAT